MGVSRDDVTVVIPVLNEGKAIGKVLDEVLSLGFKRERVLVVDGYSTDNTVEEVERRNIKVIKQHGSGKAGAIKTAIEHVTTPYMLVMDGDYSYDPRDIDKLLEHGEGYDEVIGRRPSAKISRPHRLGNWVINRLFNLVMGTSLSDVCSGMYLLRLEAVRKALIETTSFDVEVELAAQLSLNGHVTEVPIGYRDRIGEPKLKSWRHGLRIALTLISLAIKYNPLFFFGALGGMSMLPALLILTWVALEVIFRGVWHSGYALLGTMLLLFSMQSLTVASVAVMLRGFERRLISKIKERKTARF